MAFTSTAMVDIIMVSLFLHFLFSFRDHIRRRGYPYPPGPKPLPIIGNLLYSPKQSQWAAYAEMSKKHGLGDFMARNRPSLLKLASRSPGDVLYLQIFEQAIVVLCSLPAIKDLLEKRGEIYSDRPPWPMHEMCAESRPASIVVASVYPSQLTPIWRCVEWRWIGSCPSAGMESTNVRHER
jgi:hypothetical protein